MILNHNVVIDGQTVFSGERVFPGFWFSGAWKDQRPMNWLSEHQTNLRIEKELRQEHILSQHRTPLG